MSATESALVARLGGEKRDMAMLARVTGGTPVGSHRLYPTVVRVRRDRAQVAAVAAAPSAWSEWAQFALEQGAEQMVYVGMNVLEEARAPSMPPLNGSALKFR